MDERLDFLDWLRPKRGNVLDLINAAYGIRPRPGVKASANLVIARFGAILPGPRVLMLKAIRGDPSLPSFQVYGRFKATGDGAQPIIEGIASTTAVDLEGDVFAESALQDMLALRGSTAFLNHRYAWPEDVLGLITRTTLTKGAKSTALRIAVNVATDNPRAMQSYSMIKGGTRAGFSVGVIVLESHYIDQQAGGKKRLSIDRVLPLETSLCGIPSNQESWSTAAKSALQSAHVR